LPLVSLKGWGTSLAFPEPKTSPGLAVFGCLMPLLQFDMTLLDTLTLLSYIALNIDILFQIKRIYKTKSSRDLSLLGMSIRYAAILIILVKFISISDLPLIIGQALITLTFTTYFVVAVYYFANPNGHSKF
jgi:hypothetical protein